ncbi:NAD(P)-binding protein [Aaosphaeria arxii CBS 175.79]|uniref:NAD(P)-binding protein n=1 Tax=Aaosphaeria arxii CBS 175.79 TaxID=1450172 RepID=A0A6A5Y3Q3_9PLEO|nr:NAD(P)-binding protein [Aaosphaeria arxii CBS 175.79]KAF2019491.1 NAD(P)-binding protein [Aaosphaeria arxii CBS 175.79]
MPRYLITGATGQQGGGVVEALLHESGHADIEIRAITRNLSSNSAKDLQNRGIEVVKADLGDGKSLEAALRGCEAAYLVTDFRGPGGVEEEKEQGRTFVDAAVRAGVKHIVFSSVSGSEDERVEHFHSKYHIEKYIQASGLKWAVIRPVGFMDLIPPPGIGRAFFLAAMKAAFGDVKQKWIACEDIGKGAAKALMQPNHFNGKTYEIVGDVATVNEVKSALERADNGRTEWNVWLPKYLVMLFSPYHYRQMFQWLALGVQPGEVQRTKELIPDVMNVESWARKKTKQE